MAQVFAPPLSSLSVSVTAVDRYFSRMDAWTTSRQAAEERSHFETRAMLYFDEYPIVEVDRGRETARVPQEHAVCWPKITDDAEMDATLDDVIRLVDRDVSDDEEPCFPQFGGVELDSDASGEYLAGSDDELTPLI